MTAAPAPDATELETVTAAYEDAAAALGLEDDLRQAARPPATARSPSRCRCGSTTAASAFSGLPGPAQRRPRPLQGRPPVPPRRRPRRGPRAGLADDLEDRRRRPPVRRRQGRSSTSTRRELSPGRAPERHPRVMDKIEKVLGPTRDITAPDVNTEPAVMAWLMDEYGKLHGHTPAIVTGKPIALEGSVGRVEATGEGVAIVSREAARGDRPAARGRARRDPGLRQRRQPRRRRPRPPGLPDRGGERRRSARSATRPASTSTSWSGGRAAASWATRAWTVERITNEELLATDCEILVPAAVGGVLNAGQRRRRARAAGRRGAPTARRTPEADATPGRARDRGGPGRPRQRRRRDRQLPGVGPEPPEPPLGPGAGGRRARAPAARRPPPTCARAPPTAAPCGRRPTGWRWPGWRPRRRFAATSDPGAPPPG